MCNVSPDTTVSQPLSNFELKNLKQGFHSAPGFFFLDIALCTGLNTAMETVVKRVNSRSDWQDANQ